MASQPFKSPYSRLLALWNLRAFAPGLGQPSFLSNSNYTDPDIARFLGLPLDPDAETLRAMPRLLSELQRSLENSQKACLPAKARDNFAKFGVALKLNSTELRICEFLACMKVEDRLTDMGRVLRHLICYEPVRFISSVLKLPRAAVAKAMTSGGRLMKCGLLKAPYQNTNANLEFYSISLARQLLYDTYVASKLMKSFGVTSPPPAELGLMDYPHIQQSWDLLLPYLKKVISRRKRGVNVLIHGAPGTGKTQFVRLIAKALDLAVFEFDISDQDGSPLRPSSRLSALHLVQTFFQDTPVILAFDEAEDILTSSFGDRGVANIHKGWFNQMLENNAQPVFWISNKIDTLDPAFSRRFDFIIEVPIPPKAQRCRILEERVGKLVSPELIYHLSDNEHLAPAVVSRAREVVRVIAKDLGVGARDAAFTHVISDILKAQGHGDPSRTPIQPIQPGLYDIANLNTRADLQQISKQLRQNPSARLCLYGPPGTGKTAFGHWLASEIGQPLFLKKASDLVHPHVGMTERLIAQAFESARQDGAMLMIDEVDSFLQNRAHAHRSWEISQVNEMLTQIESFPGIMIASTNLIDQLDPASLRRFDIKLHFDYLRPEQAIDLLVSYCRNLELPPPTPADLSLAMDMRISTPGDFAAVARQHKFQPFRDANGLLQAVFGELDHKGSHLRRIGFQ